MEINGDQIRCHEAPDDGLAEDDGVILELRDEENDEHDLAHELDDAGEEGQDFLTEALEGVTGRDEDAEDRIEGSVPEQIPRAIFKDDRLAGAGDDAHHPLGTKVHQQDGTDGHDHRVDVDVAHPLADAVRVVRTAVLGNEGRTGGRHRHNGHIGDAEQFPGGGVTGNDEGTQTVDAVL